MVQAIRRHPAAFASLGFLVLFAVFVPRMITTNAAGPQAAPPEPLALSDALWRAGLDSESLTTAGVSGDSLSGVVSAVSDHLAANADACAAADSAFATARQQEDELGRLVRSGLGSPEDVTSYQSAKSSLESAEAARDAAVDAIFEAGAAGLTDAQTTALANMRANSDWRLPKKYLCVNRTQEEWVMLRDALANVRISADYGEEASPECVSYVGTCDADAKVASATVSLDTKLAANQAAWDTAVGL